MPLHYEPFAATVTAGNTSPEYVASYGAPAFIAPVAISGGPAILTVQVFNPLTASWQNEEATLVNPGQVLQVDSQGFRFRAAVPGGAGTVNLSVWGPALRLRTDEDDDEIIAIGGELVRRSSRIGAPVTPPSGSIVTLTAEADLRLVFQRTRGLARVADPNGANLVYGLKAGDSATYGDTLPANAASVSFVRPRATVADANPLDWFELTGEQFGATPTPTFAANAAFAGQGALAFSGAQGLSVPLLPARLPVGADVAFTMWAVFKPAATPGGAQTVWAANLNSVTNAFRNRASIDITATQTIFRAQHSTDTDANINVPLAVVPDNNPMIVIGRHRASGSGANLALVRKGGSTTTGTGTVAQALAWQFGAQPDQAFLGMNRQNGTLNQFYNGQIWEVGFLNTAIDDTATTNLLNALRAAHRIA